MKTIEKLFGASVGVISMTTLITTIAGFIGYPLPRPALWIIGIVNLLALPLLIYSSVKSLREKAGAAKNAARKVSGKPTAAEPAAAAAPETGKQPQKVRPKPHPQQLAAKKAAAGNKPKKGRKKKK